MSSSQTLSGSFSLHSLAEGSEAISEADEIHEVRNLKEKGDKAFRKKNFAEALKFYNDALEIDENTVEALSSRAAVYIEMGNYILAQQDAERLLALRPQLSKGHFQLGVALDNLGQYRDALMAFLHAMDLDSNTETMDVIANNIASLATHFCKVPEKLMEKLSEMDSYKKLCEMGACLYQNKRYELAIKVLVAAQRVQTNQKGITMKVQLTLANAHSILKHRDLAISLYQECLVTAVSAHDAQYQTKALVNIASLYLEAGDTHQAIVYYEKLMDLQKEIQGEDAEASLPEYWNQDMECALHLNLSIGYKAIGNMHKAVIHAKKYAELIKNNEARKQAEGKSYHNVGVLNEILGNYQEALDSYQEFLRISKQKGDQPGVAQAYACLGSIYATLKNRQLSLTFHEQSVSLAKKLQDARLITNAYEQMGDTYMKFEETNEAIECFMSMFRSCLRNDVRTQTNALCKLGLSYKEQMRYQYSLYYYEQAKIIGEDFDFADIKAVCEYNIACILQHSTQIYELDQAKNYFEKLIPLFEAKITQHQEEDTFCPKEFHEKHLECYDGMINVLTKLGKKQDCLVYAEAYRRFFTAKQHYNPTLTFAGNYTNSQTNLLSIWNMDKITRIVSQQNATVLYFSILSDQVLVWVLQPGVGLEQFANNRHKHAAGTKDLNRKLAELIKNLRDDPDTKVSMKYAVESRLLPSYGEQLEHLQRQNEKMSETPTSNDSLMNSKNSSSQYSKDQPPERELYDILFAPLEYFLSQLDEGHPVIIVPDKSLFNCPFNVLEQWDGKQLGERFQLTCIQSLFLLDKVVSNELQQLKAQDELEFERNQCRLGGTVKNLKPIDLHTMTETPNTLASPLEDRSTKLSQAPKGIDAKKTSNPRLTKIVQNTDGRTNKGIRSSGNNSSMQNTIRQRNDPPRPPKTVALNKKNLLGTPVKIEKILSVNSLNTISRKTATNTDIVSSEFGVTEFKQISAKDKCVIIGSPTLPNKLSLHGKQWCPPGQMQQAQNECFRIAKVFDVGAIVGADATKARFLKEIQSATVLHIATTGSMKEMALVMTPNPNLRLSEPPAECSYLVTIDDILTCPLVAKLVVLSGGWGLGVEEQPGFQLQSAFLVAGAQCVLSLLWPVPNASLEKFYHHFYTSFHAGQQVTAAVSSAMRTLQDHEMYGDILHWGAYQLIGKDVRVSLLDLHHAMLDQTVDKVEEDVSTDLQQDLLNPEPVIPHVSSKDELLNGIQECISSLLAEHSRTPNIIPLLIDMLDGALKRLHTEENVQKTSRLPQVVTQSESGMRLLKLLGFHFQAKGALVEDPFVIHPHWNLEELLVPTYDGLRSLIDLLSNLTCAQAVSELLPTTQEFVSYLVDVLCITKHAQEIQLKISDLSVKPLWKNAKVRASLQSIGYHQVGPLLMLNNVPSNRKLLSAFLQLLISVSIHKSPALLHKLDVNLLGGPESSGKVSTVTFEHTRLPSLTAVLLPRNQLRMSTPWLTSVETPDEMAEKMKLARAKSNLNKDYRKYFTRAKSWHQMTLGAQADEGLEEAGRPVTSPEKVKVISGASASSNRVPVKSMPTLTLLSTNQRRDYSHYVLQQRLDNVALRHKNDIRKVYLPYVAN